VWRVPGSDAFLVSTWELIGEATARVSDFSNHFRHAVFSADDGALRVVQTPGGTAPDVFAGADPPDHTVHRRIFAAELNPRKIERLEGAVLALADELLDGLLAARGGDAAAQLAHPLPMRVITERVIGFRSVELARVLRWVLEGSRMLGGRVRLAQVAALAAEVSDMQPWVAAQLDEAIAEPARGDVLGAAAAAVREGVLSREAAAFTLMVFIGAGGETTASLIGNAIRILAERQPLQAELRARPALVPALVEEVLRLESPFRFHPRTALRAVELGGVEIPPGAWVALLWASANRDESVFERPESTSAWGRRWPAWRRGSRSSGCWSAAPASSWTPPARRAGQTASGSVDTRACP
jgi:cytochrome P450